MSVVVKSALATVRNGPALLRILGVGVVPKCGIMSKSMRGDIPRKPKPKPFPYEKTFYGFTDVLFDRTSSRFDENTKLIVIDAPIAAGKDKFARQLAEELEMKYVPEINMDSYYINHIGYDLRKCDPKLPEIVRSYDHTNFCRDPNHINAAGFQCLMYQLRLDQYIDALAHILNTGQGVVMQRSPYSDYAFVEAMTECGYMSKIAKAGYYAAKEATINEVLKPHLIIYLDVSVKEVQDRIKKRALPHEINSKVFSDKYLETMERTWKEKYLPEMEKHCELLVYDWNGGGEAEVVIEDIERIDFDRFPFQHPKLRDWRYYQEGDWAEVRQVFTNEKDRILNYVFIPFQDAPELIIQPDDYEVFEKVIAEAPGMRWNTGFDPSRDKGLMWKNKLERKWDRNL